MGKSGLLAQDKSSKWILIAFFLFFAFMNSYSQVICEGGKVIFHNSFDQCNHNEWVLVFEDDFNGNSLDLSTWQLVQWTEGSLYGFEDKAQEYNTLDNVTVDNGTIKIFALQDTILRRAISALPDSMILSDGLPNLRTYHFTSSNIWSKKKIEYGKVEARIKIPKGKGLWPAFWLFGGDERWNEIDIFEFWNESIAGIYTPSLLSKVINMTAHYDYDNDGQTNMCHTKYTGEDYSEDFHIYAIEWEPNRIAWYLDGNCLREDYRYYNVIGQPTDCNLLMNTIYIKNKIFPVNPMNIVYNLAIQNISKGQPDDPTIFPANMYVDWIRYYRRGSNSNVSITDSTMYPLKTDTYNNIVGNTISFNCPYMINQGNQQCAVAATEVILSSGFCVEEGGVFMAMIDDNSGLRDSDTIEKSQKYTIADVKPESPIPNVSIYPTINQGHFSIEISSDDSIYDMCYVVMYDISGNKVLSQSIQGKNICSIDIPNCPNGVYVVQVFNNNGIILKTDKIIISR